VHDLSVILLVTNVLQVDAAWDTSSTAIPQHPSSTWIPTSSKADKPSQEELAHAPQSEVAALASRRRWSFGPTSGAQYEEAAAPLAVSFRLVCSICFKTSCVFQGLHYFYDTNLNYIGITILF
jgi:hypothetical protein